MAEAVVLGAPGRRRGSPFAVWADRHMKWLLVAPAILLILVLTVYPLAFSIWVAFVNFDFQIPGHAFVGLQNFEHVVVDPVAQSSILITVLFAVANVGLEFLLGLGLALAMTKTFRGRSVIMLVLIMPLFISPVIVGQFWALILQKPYGPFDYLVSQLLGHPTSVSWLTGNPWKYFSIIVADVWQWTPFIFVILLAGLTSISPELYEAAELDGVGRWRTFWHVTLPLLAPLILIAITFRLLDALKMFDAIFVLTGGGPGTSTYTTPFYLYQTGFQQFHLSQATAGSWLFLILTAVIIIFLVRRLLRPERA